MDITAQLQKIGLSDKEARIYFSLLEAGEATAQELTIRSGLLRTTAYIVLENLLKRGLINRLKRKNKIIYKVESARQILGILEKEREDLEVKIKLAKDMLPELEMLENVTGEKAKVRFFEGKEGVKMIQKDIFNSRPKFMDEIFDLNGAVKDFPPTKNDHRQKMRRKKIKSRAILIYNPKEPIPFIPPLFMQQKRYLPQGKNLFKAELVLYNNKAVILSTKGKCMGVIVENKSIVDGLRFLFNLAWQGAEKYLVIQDNRKSPKK